MDCGLRLLCSHLSSPWQPQRQIYKSPDKLGSHRVQLVITCYHINMSPSCSLLILHSVLDPSFLIQQRIYKATLQDNLNN